MYEKKENVFMFAGKLWAIFSLSYYGFLWLFWGCLWLIFPNKEKDITAAIAQFEKEVKSYRIRKTIIEKIYYPINKNNEPSPQKTIIAPKNPVYKLAIKRALNI